MFFSEKLISILDTDKVLEVGPGASPHPRSDIYLELHYEDEGERIAQSGHVGVLETNKPIVFYNGGRFPFKDYEFDYVICSHVLEHVKDADLFLKEIQRVGKKGYIEFPTLYYDYIYNFPEHQLFLLYREGIINWMTKAETDLSKFLPVQKFFHKTLQLKYYELIESLRDYFFQGFEWFDSIESKKVSDINLLTYNNDEVLASRIKHITTPINYSTVSFKKHFKFKVKNFFK